MGLGDFADSSTGSGTSSKSRGPEDDAKEADKNPPQEEHMTMDKDEEENRKGSRPEEKMDEDLVAPSPPRVSSTSSERKPSFTMGLRKRAGPGRSGAAAFDDGSDVCDEFGPRSPSRLLRTLRLPPSDTRRQKHRFIRIIIKKKKSPTLPPTEGEPARAGR